MKRRVGLPILMFVLIALDQWVKAWVVGHISLGAIRAFIPHIVSLTYLQNTGAAFSLLENQQWLFTVITIIVIGGALYYLYRNINASPWLLTGLTLVISGGIGNFIDRLRQGFVVDMFHLDFMNFAIFNVADMYLTVGVLVLLIVIFKEEMNGSKN